MREESEYAKRKRLEWQSRKRGITENDLLLSTFAEKYLPAFSMDEMLAYDRIINATTYDPTITEWDLYYWFTEARDYPPELVKDASMTADYATEAIPGVAEMMSRIIEHSKNKKREILLQPELQRDLL